jgi:uncharacterized protein YdbL (DUF1318 family)
VFVSALSFTTLALAQYDIKTMTPEVQKALEGRKSRYSDLKALKASGAVGENNKGYVEVLNGDAGAQQLVQAENADREAIYKTIAQQNDLGDALNVIEETFAKVQRDKASAGEMIQDSDGNWAKK